MRAQSTADAGEFPFVEELPKAVAREVATGIEAFQLVVRDYKAAQERHGILVPVTTVAEALGVTTGRVTALMEENRLDSVEVRGRRWVVAASVERYLQEGPRRPGRPRKLTKVGNSVRLGVELAAAAEALMDGQKR